MKTKIYSGILAGVFATYVMDLLNILISKTGLVSASKPEGVGRVFYNWMIGNFVNESFFVMEKSAHEDLFGLAGHYLIGVVLALIFIAACEKAFGRVRLGLYPIAFGVATSVFAWFLMFPSMGFGVFGLEAPPQIHLLRTSLFNHSFYGIGLALGFWLVNGIHPIVQLRKPAMPVDRRVAIEAA
jgi:hypothetical protein